MKPKLLIAVLCKTERDGWINPSLCQDLLKMQIDPRWNVCVHMVRDICQHDAARNAAVVMARKLDADYLWMLDNDNSFGARLKPMDILTDAANRGIDVFALPYFRHEGMSGRQSTIRGEVHGMTPDGAWTSIDRVSTGTMALSKRVWQTIKGPWFKFEFDDTEEHTITKAESFYFCDLARANGFTVWHSRQGAEHWKTDELSSHVNG